MGICAGRGHGAVSQILSSSLLGPEEFSGAVTRGQSRAAGVA